ncbi:hypothetical protein DBR40_12660 [Pedobacter sp. KBW01]|uniref:hypothetical protein n=1 Tax=Pedobacter sp. KBW01 TaxID=2153364 RepID=UPI000F5B03DA|nr:hypothetical protein [Pedobacter sp. KBW01]RQO76728.1 hypothetical protein DBR40_12660 [Pedobacter sp. KBW01]
MSILTSDSSWHNELIKALAACKVDCRFFLEGEFQLLKLTDQLVINLVSLNNPFDPQNLIQLQEKYAIANLKLIHLWEDIWYLKPAQVLARLTSLLGQNKRVHGRKTKIHKIAKPEADTFLNENHLQGAVSSRYKIGLFEKDELVAVATFSALRKMNHTENYKSAELIRFAVKAGYSITGGLSKLISYFAALYQPNDLMTYADRDWSAGEAYLRLGFLQTAVVTPQYYGLNGQLQRQLIKDAQIGDAQIFNTGSLKFILKF